MTDDPLLLEARPSWWKFVWHLVFFWLLFVPPAVAWVRRRSLALRVYADRVQLARGFFSREVKDIFIADIRTVHVIQSFWGRLVGIGDIRVDAAGSSNEEIQAAGLPDPDGIRRLILRQRREEKGSGD